MQEIKNWGDVNPFRRSIIAYKTDDFFWGDKEGYILNADQSIQYGYIEADILSLHTKEKAYRLFKLLKPERDWVCRTCISDTPLNLSPLYMRHATSEETLAIKKAIDAKAARFEHFCGESKAAKVNKIVLNQVFLNLDPI